MGTCVVGNILLELDRERVTIICLGTHQYLVKKLGLMIVQRRGGEQLNLTTGTSGIWLVSSEMCVVVVLVALVININSLLQEEEKPDFEKDVGLL